jgi:signal transduction histidine kinase/ActR/RegA family two-component response regulator
MATRVLLYTREDAPPSPLTEGLRQALREAAQGVGADVLERTTRGESAGGEAAAAAPGAPTPSPDAAPQRPTAGAAPFDGLPDGEAAAAEPQLVVIGPDVPRPLSLARRLGRRWPRARCLLALDPAQEAQVRQAAVFGAPPGGRCTLERADSPLLPQRLGEALAAASQQGRLRTTLDRMRLQLHTQASVDPSEYRRLVASDRYLASVLGAAQDAIVSLDEDGRVVTWNTGAERLFGRRQAQVAGLALAELFDDPPAFAAAVQAVQAGQAVPGPDAGREGAQGAQDGLPGDGRRRAFGVHRQGQALHIEASFDLIRNELGGGIGVLAIMRDVTAQRAAEQALQSANRQKDEFLAMLAHELRNPLAPIRAASEILRRLNSTDARAQQAATIIARQVEHMTGLIDDLLDVARVTRGMVALERAPVDLDSIVAPAVEQVRALIESKRQTLLVPAFGEALHVDGDRKRLTQVVANLLNNAAKYTPEGGRISIELGASAEQIQLVVRDTGVGMDAELLPRVFDLFSQGQRSHDRAQGGLGIGLALVRNLVQLHGGTVQAASDGPGRGSCFTVTLPRLQAQPQPAQQPQAAPPPDFPAGNRLRLMVVDDNRDAAETLALLLESQGHTVDVQNDPRAALEKADRVHPDVFILDIGMPHLDGYELAQRLRARPGGMQAVIIALTGYGQAEDVARARDAGFDHHLVKPLDASRLSTLLQDVVPQTRH